MDAILQPENMDPANGGPQRTWSYPMTPSACPFCGMATNLPHNTQQGCIEALHREISKTREILGLVRPKPPERSSESHERRLPD